MQKTVSDRKGKQNDEVKGGLVLAKQGWAYQRTGKLIRTWQKRWLVLQTPSQGQKGGSSSSPPSPRLVVFSGPADKKPLQVIPLDGVAVLPAAVQAQRRNAWKVAHPKRSPHFFAASSQEEMDGWIAHLVGEAEMELRKSETCSKPDNAALTHLNLTHLKVVDEEDDLLGEWTDLQLPSSNKNRNQIDEEENEKEDENENENENENEIDTHINEKGKRKEKVGDTNDKDKDKGKEKVEDKENSEVKSSFGGRKAKTVEEWMKEADKKFGSSSKNSFLQARLEFLYQRYHQLNDPEDEEEGVGPNGIEQLCEDIGVEPEDVRMLVLAWHMQAKTMGFFSRQEFIDGLKKLQVDSIHKLRQTFAAQLMQDLKDAKKFKQIWKFAFLFTKDAESKVLDIPTADALMTLLLPQDTTTFPHTRNFQNYLLQQKSYQVLNLDQWTNFLDFNEQIKPDFSNYNEESAWPTILDEFVEWSKQNSYS
jgi:DCN1-like protein 4/5